MTTLGTFAAFSPFGRGARILPQGTPKSGVCRTEFTRAQAVPIRNSLRVYAVVDDRGSKKASMMLDLSKLVDEGPANPVLEREIVSVSDGHIARLLSDGVEVYSAGVFQTRDEAIAALDSQEAKP